MNRRLALLFCAVALNSTFQLHARADVADPGTANLHAQLYSLILSRLMSMQLPVFPSFRADSRRNPRSLELAG